MRLPSLPSPLSALLSVSTLALFTALGACATPAATFATPDEALQALVDCAKDRALVDKLLGPGGFEVLSSGDEVSDHEDLEAVRALIAERVAFEADGDDRKIALLGIAEWPLAIPLVRAEGGWRFDVEAGMDEVLSRRIGRNELSTIATLRACVEAQLEYAAVARDGNPACFASRWASSEGMQDGLYWPTAEGQPQSPLGPLVAAAAAAGYGRSAGDSVPYMGYHYRILTAQGPGAPGGARDYTDENGRLRAGFAFLAWPTTYDNSGIMTFIVNQQGIVFERDFGPQTSREVESIQTYEPNATWNPVVD